MESKLTEFIQWGLKYAYGYSYDSLCGLLYTHDGYETNYLLPGGTIYNGFLHATAEGFNRQADNIWIEIHKSMVSLDSRNLWNPVDFVYSNVLSDIIGTHDSLADALESALDHIMIRGWYE